MPFSALIVADEIPTSLPNVINASGWVVRKIHGPRLSSVFAQTVLLSTRLSPAETCDPAISRMRGSPFILGWRPTCIPFDLSHRRKRTLFRVPADDRSAPTERSNLLAIVMSHL